MKLLSFILISGENTGILYYAIVSKESLSNCNNVCCSVRAEALVALNACIVSEIPSVCAVAKQLFVTEDSRTTGNDLLKLILLFIGAV